MSASCAGAGGAAASSNSDGWAARGRTLAALTTSLAPAHPEAPQLPLQDVGAFQLALPYGEDVVAERAESGDLRGISLHVSSQLVLPELSIRRGDFSATAGDVVVPKASVREDRLTPRLTSDVRAARERADIQPVTG